MNFGNYVKLDPREHVLKRPGMYMDTVKTETIQRWIYDPAIKRMVWKEIQFCPGLFKIFDEILVNALDHHVRQQEVIKKGSVAIPVSQIRITLTPTEITIQNDGDTLPTDIHPEYKCPIPEMLFGQLLTSSNYDDTEEKIVGGKNGIGAKLTNIFSTEFTVKVVQPKTQTMSTYVWKDNMTTVVPVKTSKMKSAGPSTSFTFKPDLSRFQWPGGTTITEIPQDMLDVFRTRCYEAAVCVAPRSKSHGCKIFLNNEHLALPSLVAFMDLFLPLESALPDAIKKLTPKKRKEALIAFDVAGERWEIGAVLTSHLYDEDPPAERHISFVNGILTRRGGKHVDYVAKQVLTKFCALAKKKKVEITPALLKDSVTWFVRSVIVNPEFDGQIKEYLKTADSEFGSKPKITDEFVESLVKIGLLEEAQHILNAKQMKEAKKTDGKKKATVRGIPKLEDALWAGTAKSTECTLILTEGDSAASTAISGLKVVGRERYGVFPLRGKLLNVKDAVLAKKTNNAELNQIKQILGLEYGKKYAKLEQLRYGRVMIMTDQDVDGSHIKGLLINLFHTEWPALLKMGFLCCLMTPLLKVTKGSTTLSFYSQQDYDVWVATAPEAQIGNWKSKYYKGLGTSTAAEAREYFENMHTADFEWDDSADGSIDMAFNKKRSDDRKTWLSTYDAKRVLTVSKGGSKVPYTKFINDELIHFSSADNIRSIPSILDGLKPGQRKILWSCFKRNLTQEIRVAQLAGYVSETAAYHHGEASLTSTIVGMAQIFVGSNNINLLAPNGQFGTRLMGGKDAASPRYIHTQLETIMKTIFRKDDEPILDYTDDDGTLVEPVAYYPVLPMLLVNGSVGIGTGFSTDILPYNPVDLVAGIRALLTGEVKSLDGWTWKPWWLGFRGDVRIPTGTDKKGWMTSGMFEFMSDEKRQIRIKELPVGTWTRDYKEFLDLVASGELPGFDEQGGKLTLKNYEEAYNDVDVDFILTLSDEAYWNAKTYPTEFMTKFKLNTTFRLTNMVAFDSAGKIRRYSSVGEILEEFVSARLSAYDRRKTYKLSALKAALLELKAKHTFISAIVNGSLKISNVDDAILLASLKALDLPPLSLATQTVETATLDGYEYLLRMRIDRLKASAILTLDKEIKGVEDEISELDATTIQNLWLKDLDDFMTAWSAYEIRRQDINTPAEGVKPPKKKVVRKKV
jgi:DNA topoisomerase-2